MRNSRKVSKVLVAGVVAATLAVGSPEAGAALVVPACSAFDLAVGTEAEYRAAVTCTTDGSERRQIELTQDIVLDDGPDPVFAGVEELSIDGNGFTIDAGGSSRVLDQAVPSLLIFVDITVRGGMAEEGGAVRTPGEVIIQGSVFEDNNASAIGGGVFANDGPVTVTDTTFARNSSAFGGGIYTNGDLQIVNSTFDTSTVIVEEATTLTHATMNSSQVRGDSVDSFASVLTGPGSPCHVVTSTSQGYNYVTSNACAFGDPTDTENAADPMLGPLRNNGGFVSAFGGGDFETPTMFPLNGSPLIDAIPLADCSLASVLEFDQRRIIERPFGAGCDIGAIEAVFPAHGFSGVGPFYEPTVRWITSTVNTPNILDGYNDGTFRHKRDINRGQAARLYYRAAGEPDISGLDPHGFTDVTPFFENAVRWAKANGIFNGYDIDNTFRERNPITRGDSIRTLYGFAGSPDPGVVPHGFTGVGPFYNDAVTWAKAHGLVNGYDDNTFRQRNNITRGDASRTAYNLAQTPAAWDNPGTAPPNMLFQDNTAP